MTALKVDIAYEKAAKNLSDPIDEDITLREAAMKLSFLTGEQFDSCVRPEEMTHLLGGDR